VVVVAEHRHRAVAGPHPPQRPGEPRGDLRRRNVREIVRGNKVPCKRHEVRPFTVDDPNNLREACGRHPSVGVNVADLDDPIPVENPGQPRERYLAALYLHPPRLHATRVAHAQNPGSRRREPRHPEEATPG